MDLFERTPGIFLIYPLSEYAVTLEFGDEINTENLQRIRKFDALLHKQPFEGFQTSVPAYTTLSIFFDPTKVIHSFQLDGLGCYERVSRYLSALGREVSNILLPEPRTLTIPVCYGGIFGLDLAEVAQMHGISPESVHRLHTSAVYEVHMIGFTPGFAYLGGMDEQLTTPRKPTPRSAVPAGSVGIAGKQTGIYSLETPGGWQIIGRTPLRLFDPIAASPTLLNAGDRVVFKAITPNEFETYHHRRDADTNA